MDQKEMIMRVSSNAPLTLDDKQSEEFAKQIIGCINDYINTHRAEYEKWLAENYNEQQAIHNI